MLYVIVQKNDASQLPVKDQVFKTYNEADIERIYLQPDYDDLLQVKEIV